MNLLGSFVVAFSMYSKIPMPHVEWTEERMRFALCFFPLVGAVIGGLLYVLAFVLKKAEAGSLCFAFAGTVLPLLVTGGIHMDGFLDVADAKSSYGSREKKLEILKDPHVGAFAVIWFGIYVFLYAGAFSELDMAAVSLFSVTFVLTRALNGLSLVTFPMAKKDGLAALFSGMAVKRTVRKTMVCYVAISGFWMIYLGKWTGGICLAGAGILYARYYKRVIREFGGTTGDLAGHFLQSCELLILVLICICGLIQKAAEVFI